MTAWPKNRLERKTRLQAAIAAALTVGASAFALQTGPAGANIAPAPPALTALAFPSENAGMNAAVSATVSAAIPATMSGFSRMAPPLPVMARLDGRIADPETTGWTAPRGPLAASAVASGFGSDLDVVTARSVAVGEPNVRPPAVPPAARPPRTAGSAAGPASTEALFGTVAIPTGRTVHGPAWARALADSLDIQAPDGQARSKGNAAGERPHGRCDQAGAWCRFKLLDQARHMIQDMADLPLDARIGRINRFVNRAIRFEDDLAGYGTADHWATASETLRRGRGDCEDIAILKMALLKAAGFAAHDLVLVLGREPAGGRDHAVLVVRRPIGGAVVLDNLTDALSPAADPTRLEPMLSFSTDGAWIHGRRVAVASHQGLSQRALAHQPPVRGRSGDKLTHAVTTRTASR